MANQTITHLGPKGPTKDEQQVQNDFAAQLMEAAKKKQAELNKAKGGKK